MKRFFMISTVCVMALTCFGCLTGLPTQTAPATTATSPATTTTTPGFASKVETAIENVKWNDLLGYWQAFDTGLNELLPIIEVAFPGTTKIDGVIGKVATNANTAVSDLATAVTAVKAGTITEAQAQTIADDVKTQVMQANTTISQAAYAAKKIVPMVKPAVPTVSPTIAPAPATK